MFKDLFLISLTPLVFKYHRILTKGVEAPHVTPDVLVVWGPRDTRRCTGRWAPLPWPIYTPGTLPWSWTAGGTILFGVVINQLCSTQLCMKSLKSFNLNI